MKQAIQTFEDLMIRQGARRITNTVYDCCVDLRDYGFRDQIQRASVSVMNNIAEGFERKTIKDKRKFLYIARGSCGEVRSMMYIAIDRGYIADEEGNDIIQELFSLSKMITAFITNIKH